MVYPILFFHFLRLDSASHIVSDASCFHPTTLEHFLYYFYVGMRAAAPTVEVARVQTVSKVPAWISRAEGTDRLHPIRARVLVSLMQNRDAVLPGERNKVEDFRHGSAFLSVNPTSYSGSCPGFLVLDEERILTGKVCISYPSFRADGEQPFFGISLPVLGGPVEL